MIKAISKKIKNIFTTIKIEQEKNIYKPNYKIIQILENEDNQHHVVIKLINKNLIFNVKPEEVLANDDLVDQFSPRDVRALTYLGYLGINSPKYKILAKKLSKNEKITFVIRKKGDPKIITKTANEIIQEADIIRQMNPTDANTVGYTLASEAIQDEKKEKERLLTNTDKKA